MHHGQVRMGFGYERLLIALTAPRNPILLIVVTVNSEFVVDKMVKEHVFDQSVRFL
jgi:hypothetical protein